MVTACIIVGGGLAGMVAARRLQQLGVAATVLEKGNVEGGIGNVVISGGLFHIAWQPPDVPADMKRRHLIAETAGEIDPELALALAQESDHLIPWLEAEGVEMRPKTDDPASRWTLWPFRAGPGRRLMPDLGPSRAMQHLYRRFVGAGGDLRLGVTAHTLEPGAGLWRVAYRSGSGDGSAEAACVLFADGGFQANKELLSRYVGPNAGLCLLRASTSGTGDGLRMLLENGADAVGLGRVYGHLVSIDALTSDELWPFPHLDELCLAGLVVTRYGGRVPVDTSAVGLVTRMARSDDPRGFIAVFDEDLWNSSHARGKLGLPAPNPELIKRGARMFSSPTLAGLAEQLGMEPDRLLTAVADHNSVRVDAPLESAPFHAVPIVPGITFTMGGVKIGPNAEVRRPSGEPIHGLYAAGSTVGGIQGGPDGGYVGGLATAATFGFIAASSIALQMQATVTPSSRRSSSGNSLGD